MYNGRRSWLEQLVQDASQPVITMPPDDIGPYVPPEQPTMAGILPMLIIGGLGIAFFSWMFRGRRK